ncbi:MAG: MetQ/NlpA family ABC transporter substrate-binding protein [Clostridiaceae bacterium]|nr:MetQ/NlpA family ABC transporter substrate-binding protein [Clostridiaceae bacterium]
MKKLISLIAILALVFTLGACASSQDTDGNQDSQQSSEQKDGAVVKLGVVGEANEAWQPVIEKLAKEDITLEIVSFSDYTLPNQALDDGDIDLNSFQHYAFLNNDIEKNGYKLTAIGETVIAPLGLYSQKIKDISEIKNGDSIAIPSDTTNGGRALKLLESAGLIKVDPAAGYTPFVTDITENPLKLEFVEVEASLTPGLLPDVAAAVINGGHAVDNGLVPSEDAIYLEKVEDGADNPYINVIVARTEDKDNEVYKKVVEYYQTDEVAAIIKEQYKGSYITVW